MLVPKRAIETWIHFFLNASPVSEELSYPKYRGCESDAAPAAETFAKHKKEGSPPPDAPPSLLVALGEAKRIP